MVYTQPQAKFCDSQNIQMSKYICGLDPTTDQVLWQSQNIQRSKHICGLAVPEMDGRPVAKCD